MISRGKSSLRNGILTIVMVSFAVLSLIYGVLLELTIDDYRESRIADHDRYTAIVRRNLTYELDHLMELSTNLSRPRDIVESIEESDNGVLSDWGKAFTKTVGSVVFTDLDGVVIARAPDEFRFADSLSSDIYFEEAGKKGFFLGIAPVDGRDSFVACRPVLKYDDVPVGYLVVSKAIIPSFLKTLLPQDNMKLTFSDEMDSDLSRENSSSREAHRIIEVGGGFFSLDFLPSPEYRELLRLQNSLILAFLAVTGGSVFFLLYFLKKRFEPYTRMVEALVDYSERKTDLDGLLDVVSEISSGAYYEISYTCEALKDMILVLKDKMENIQSYSDRLEYLANRDSLTGLWNRRKMDQILLSETERSSRYGASLSVVMVDIDHIMWRDMIGPATLARAVAVPAAMPKRNLREGLIPSKVDPSFFRRDDRILSPSMDRTTQPMTDRNSSPSILSIKRHPRPIPTTAPARRVKISLFSLAASNL
ncbi:MAG: diguanylate cyclase [Synergistota bacterium]|nr:diguanylate cyclase [Synergistota bacterium]